MAEEHGLDLTGVEGTGTGGRVTREDVESTWCANDGTARPRPRPRPLPLARCLRLQCRSRPHLPTRARDRAQRMSRRRQTIAQRLLEAQRTAAMLTTFNEADMSAIMAIRARRREGVFSSATALGLASCRSLPAPSFQP